MFTAKWEVCNAYARTKESEPFYVILIYILFDFYLITIYATRKGGPYYTTLAECHIESFLLHPRLVVFGSVPVTSAPVRFHWSGATSQATIT